eukprot:TRINITY_DN337535_c0_g2_i1.p1 TRINITY_DN337535_c0_g2~~TRINITY_DN337535_c0_g2_i1.p1  ORF type:complete len:964 (+),score=240.30 TRINITY_DN337535_c0_g2_i1:253-2892(+)
MLHTDLRAKVTNQQKRIEELTEQIHEESNKNIQMESVNKTQTKEFEMKIGTLNNEKETLLEKIVDLEEIHEKLEEKYTITVNENVGLQNEIDLKNASVMALESINDQLVNEKEELLKNKERDSTKIIMLEAEVARLQAISRDLSKQTNTKKVSLEVLAKDIKTFQNKLENANSEVNDLSDRLKELTNENQAFKEERELLLETRESQLMKLNSHETSLTKRTEELKKQQAILQEMKMNLGVWEERNGLLTADIECQLIEKARLHFDDKIKNEILYKTKKQLNLKTEEASLLQIRVDNMMTEIEKNEENVQKLKADLQHSQHRIQRISKDKININAELMAERSKSKGLKEWNITTQVQIDKYKTACKQAERGRTLVMGRLTALKQRLAIIEEQKQLNEHKDMSNIDEDNNNNDHSTSNSNNERPPTAGRKGNHHSNNIKSKTNPLFSKSRPRIVRSVSPKSISRRRVSNGSVGRTSIVPPIANKMDSMTSKSKVRRSSSSRDNNNNNNNPSSSSSSSSLMTSMRTRSRPSMPNLPRSNRPTLPAGYSSIRELGKGGFGSVWLAKEESTSSMVAIKALPHDSDSAHREQRAAEMLGTQDMSNSCFCPLLRTLEDSQSTWIIQEPGGTSLHKLLFSIKGETRNGSRTYVVSHLPLMQRLRRDKGFLRLFLNKLIESVLELSNNGLVHADLKPDNILVGDVHKDDASAFDEMELNENNLNLKVIDFGCSFPFDDPPSSFAGISPEYLPPEVLLVMQGSSHATAALKDESLPHSLDCWSIGCIMLEIACGFPLWFPYPSIFESGGHQWSIKSGLFAAQNMSRDMSKVVLRQKAVVNGIPKHLSKFPKLPELCDGNGLKLIESLLQWHAMDRVSPGVALMCAFFEE